MTVDSNHEGCPNYFPNSFSGPQDDVRKYSESKFQASTKDVARFNSADEDNFTQCGIFYRNVLTADERYRLYSCSFSIYRINFNIRLLAWIILLPILLTPKSSSRRGPLSNLAMLTRSTEHNYELVSTITTVRRSLQPLQLLTSK